MSESRGEVEPSKVEPRLTKVIRKLAKPVAPYLAAAVSTAGVLTADAPRPIVQQPTVAAAAVAEASKLSEKEQELMDKLTAINQTIKKDLKGDQITDLAKIYRLAYDRRTPLMALMELNPGLARQILDGQFSEGQLNQAARKILESVLPKQPPADLPTAFDRLPKEELVEKRVVNQEGNLKQVVGENFSGTPQISYAQGFEVVGADGSSTYFGLKLVEQMDKKFNLDKPVTIEDGHRLGSTMLAYKISQP